MIWLNPKTNLMEEIEHNFALQDSDRPYLFRDLFSYEEIPRIAFNNISVPKNMPEEIWITDTTFRDGQQARKPYTVEQIVHIYKELHRLGGPKGLVRQSEFFLYTQKDKEAVYKCRELGYEFPEVTSWIRASKKDFQMVREMELEETGILVSCSDYHIYKKMKMTRKQALDHYVGVVKDCIETGVRPRCHFEDITRADFYQFVVPFAIELWKIGQEAGMPVKIRACDTMGYGVSYPGVMLPRSVPGIIHGLYHYARIPSDMIEWHGHNDFYKSVSNASNAWLYGASAVNCSMFGIGERTGNTPLEAMVIEYAQFKGALDSMDPTVITDLADYYTNELGYRIPPRTPFAGSEFNLTRAGVHADGLLKNEEIYNIFDTDKILNRPVKIAISNTSGTSGIAHWINSNFKLKDEDSVVKTNGLVIAVKEWVDRQFDEGRTTVIGDAELMEVVLQFKQDMGVEF
ncbi:MAG: 2-isopropylmalate synthase [Oscillospiraceae bacterium]|jgi:isopropylmalate/homocitrate/citramalate synthase|nr:2-isopropylmalate synthase [Oscillospiraceae bacterium]